MQMYKLPSRSHPNTSRSLKFFLSQKEFLSFGVVVRVLLILGNDKELNL